MIRIPRPPYLGRFTYNLLSVAGWLMIGSVVAYVFVEYFFGG